jgi:phosphatidylinositol glycan class B
MLLAGPMWLGQVVAPGSLLYVILPRAAAACFASLAMIAANLIGRSVSPRHAIAAMGAIALWYESVYFSVHVLTESLAVAAFLLAAAVSEPGVTRGRLVAGGALLMLTAVFRIHYGPAIAVFALVLLRLRWRDWLWLVLGAALVASASSAVDLTMGQRPFGWVFANYYQNIVANKAASFGTFGPEAYFQMLWLHWQFAAVPILWLAAKSARRFPALALAAVVNLAVHLLIGHKEYRFILLSTQIAILLAAIGAVDLVDGIRSSRGKLKPASWTVIAIMLAGWSGLSLLIGTSDLGTLGWRRFEGGFRLAREAYQRRSCGVALMGGSSWAAGGATYLHDIPLYTVLSSSKGVEARQVSETSYAYDAVIMLADRPNLIPYRRLACDGDGIDRLCLAVRAGGCRQDSLSESRRMQHVMERLGR